jgi:GTP cyclohydrolase I
MNRKQKKKPLEIAAITNFPTPCTKPCLSNEDKKEKIAGHFKAIMEILGLDLTDISLAKTPHRIAKMYVEEIFSGLDTANFPNISLIEDQYQHDEHSNIVFVKVTFNSFCEHHFVPMNGFAYIAYLPKGKLIGLSKIPRIVRYFAKRPQLQERLGAQIADCLTMLLGTEDVAVSLLAQHFCVIARGVENEESHTITNVLRGQFDTDGDLRREFFEAINRK